MTCELTSELRELPASKLRLTFPDTIINYMKSHWEKIRIKFADAGSVISVAEGWHGAGKTGDAIVFLRDLLTARVAGTKLTPAVFTSWLERNNFTFPSDQGFNSPEIAAVNLASEAHSAENRPVFRAIRNGEGQIPILIEFYYGSQARLVKDLSTIGNQSDLTADNRERYRTIVADLMRPFLSKGTTTAKKVLAIPQDSSKIRRVDDCAAALTTVFGDILLCDSLGYKPNQKFEVVDVAIATTQAVTIAIHLAELRGVPLILRAGAPSFGLAGTDLGLNYMLNTQADMLEIGAYTSGDFGAIMKGAKEDRLPPQRIIFGNGTPNNETRIFLNGGWPILNMMQAMLKDDGKDKVYNGLVSVLRASRIDDGPGEWGVVFSGVNL